MTPNRIIMPIRKALLWRVSPIEAMYMLPNSAPIPLAEMSQPAPLALTLSVSLAKAGKI